MTTGCAPSVFDSCSHGAWAWLSFWTPIDRIDSFSGSRVTFMTLPLWQCHVFPFQVRYESVRFVSTPKSFFVYLEPFWLKKGARKKVNIKSKYKYICAVQIHTSIQCTSLCRHFAFWILYLLQKLLDATTLPVLNPLIQHFTENKLINTECKERCLGCIKSISLWNHDLLCIYPENIPCIPFFSNSLCQLIGQDGPSALPVTSLLCVW